ncbi:MAG TPA: UdgX family uracil-DNA binding protein [Actinomycetota bacterium]|nr:UdgX family uracil-DNA binding protein [Actinomycetota bacterium]
MAEETAAAYLPDRLSLASLRSAASVCRGCHLYRDATQTVFGDGKRGARLILVGEQPGDKEDLAGEPFVGPAGRILDEALTAAGIERDEAYVTNVVKHFKFEQRGKRRIHKKPNAAEVRACRPWLEAEIEVVRPEALVALGATAAGALFGASVKVSQQRGQPIESALAPFATATVHPSSILRSRDRASREAAMQAFTDDLRSVARHLG